MMAANVFAKGSPRDTGPPNRGSGSAEVRTIDGVGNNLTHSDWGSTGQNLLPITSMEYADGIAAPSGQDRLSPRVISNAVVAQTESLENERGLTDLVWMWGQFIDHDIDLTGQVSPVEPFDIVVPAGDPHFDPEWTDEARISLSRSLYDHETGVTTPRLQVNEITAFIDGSVIYGSDHVRASELRLFSGGLLKTSVGDLLPFNDAGLENAGGTSNSLFLAGDVRANENAALCAMQTLWVREHNRVARRISAGKPSLSDEQVFQQAKSIVVAELQAITYNEFLPALLGDNAISKYTGYDPTVNPGISNIFSTAAYRFGHSMLSPELLRVDNDGNEAASGNLSLRDAFFAPHALTEYGIDSLLLGAAQQRAQEVDTMIVEDVRSFLFGPPGAGGFDLASLNMQRGRDHGLADYRQVRLDLGLSPVDDFDDITTDVALQNKLKSVYADVADIDVWVGGLAEDHVAGSSVGELIQTVLVDQFERLRDGDRFWYQNVFRGALLREIESTTLAAVIQRNTGVSDLQDAVFFVAERQPDQKDGRGAGGKHGGPLSPRLHPGPMRPLLRKLTELKSLAPRPRDTTSLQPPGLVQLARIVKALAASRDDSENDDSEHDDWNAGREGQLCDGLAAALKMLNSNGPS
jgi:hypothetical protein